MTAAPDLTWPVTVPTDQQLEPEHDKLDYFLNFAIDKIALKRARVTGEAAEQYSIAIRKVQEAQMWAHRAAAGKE